MVVYHNYLPIFVSNQLKELVGKKTQSVKMYEVRSEVTVILSTWLGRELLVVTFYNFISYFEELKMFSKVENKNVKSYLQKLVEEKRKPVGQHFLCDGLSPANRHKAHNEHMIPTLLLPS